jgi:hypothetical protein
VAGDPGPGNWLVQSELCKQILFYRN